MSFRNAHKKQLSATFNLTRTCQCCGEQDYIINAPLGLSSFEDSIDEAIDNIGGDRVTCGKCLLAQEQRTAEPAVEVASLLPRLPYEYLRDEDVSYSPVDEDTAFLNLVTVPQD